MGFLPYSVLKIVGSFLGIRGLPSTPKDERTFKDAISLKTQPQAEHK